MAAKANLVLENLIVESFPKGSHVFERDGKQAGTVKIIDLNVR